ncbi:putative membrane protein [Peptoniphilus sp. ING2-D1G]|nr:putative membrane protein [Peptoniphilus sp. ING2-D1G]
MGFKPYLYSILLTVLILIFPITSGVLIYIMEIAGSDADLIQGIFFIFGGIIGLIIAKAHFTEVEEIGLSTPQPSNYNYLIPLAIVEGAVLLFGLKPGINLDDILKYFIFAFAVGFTEELYFRGMIFNILKDKSINKAVVVTSLLFSIGHIFNLMSGAPLIDTILQIILALAFSLTTIMILLDSSSLMIPIIFHGTHNFLSRITIELSVSLNFIAGALQVLIYIAIGIYLWKRHQKN